MLPELLQAIDGGVVLLLATIGTYATLAAIVTSPTFDEIEEDER